MTAGRPRLAIAVAAVAGLFALTGCGGITISTDPVPDETYTEPVSSGAFDANGNLPNPCTLLTPADVNEVTRREITRIDRSRSAEGPDRFCRWELEQGELTLFISPTSADDFEKREPGAEDVDGLSDAAYKTPSGHLFVRELNVYLDVYTTAANGGAASSQNIAIGELVAEKVFSKF
ncbi:hypothetical protein [Cryptosporangium japonicum]|uniref:DUF3558 domain-containing protein n=1 Tax=Cryptosporangium japonicum TaxID=80872 RepID=A0ABN0UZX9_9ACTN